MSGKRDLGEYVNEARASTQRYAKDLLDEHEKLLGFAASLHHEKLRLESEVVALREQIGRFQAAESSLKDQLAGMEASNRAFSERYADVETLNSNLANLYVASYRIHGSLARDEIVSTIVEIVVNVIGSEEFVLLERPDDATPMRPIGSFGVDVERLEVARFCDGPIGHAIESGETVIAEGGEGSRERPLACVPLKVGDRVIGVLVIFRLLAHKARLESIDHELFGLLATHAASALYCSELHGRAVRGATA
jgi:hypothetical protein